MKDGGDDKAQSDNCMACGDNVSIVHINIATGLCTTCNRANVKQSNRELLKKMIEVYDVIQGKKNAKDF
jgi:tRNA uridine 5-carbamoylmethylation protein Kti12